MNLYSGTSGYAYKEWKGFFYPDDLPAHRWLQFYGEHFQSVEINNTFYRMPSRKLLAGWALEVPENFRFVIKASQRITHFKRLRGTDDELAYLLDTVEELGQKLGPVFFQLPPRMRKDAGLLDAFLMQLPPHRQVVFQFGDVSWLADDVLDLLRRDNRALCLTDEEKKETPLVATADWGYLRLRNGAYSDDDLRAWSTRVRQFGWRDAFVFFKHEEQAPLLAQRFAALFGADR